MDAGCFYYLCDQYFETFPDNGLMHNKESSHGSLHNRPCFYAFQDRTSGLFWLIPISSQVQKYRAYYNRKTARYGKCDTIVFGEVLGHEKVFLIQNMCPATPDYISNQYIDAVTGKPVRISGKIEKELIIKAKKVLALQRQGKNLIFPDVLEIERKLLNLSEK